MRRDRLKRVRWVLAGALLPLLLAACTAPASDRVVTPQGYDILRLYLLELGIAAFILAVVVTILVVAIIRSRRLPPDAEVPQTSGSLKIEIIYTSIPIAIETTLLVLSLLIMGVVRAPAPSNALTIRVIGHQWYWEYIYPAQRVTANGELHIPVNTPLHLEVESADVIHSFWVPQFGWKIDAIPGMTNIMNMTVTQTGTFQGACVEFCGNQHAWMRTLVIAESPSQFQNWARSNAAPAAAPTSPEAIRGEQLFLSNTCASCHTIAGTAAQGTVGPDLTHVGSGQYLGSGAIRNTPANMQRWISNAQAIKPGIHMPAFASLSPADVKALATYLEGLK